MRTEIGVDPLQYPVATAFSDAEFRIVGVNGAWMQLTACYAHIRNLRATLNVDPANPRFIAKIGKGYALVLGRKTSCCDA